MHDGHAVRRAARPDHALRVGRPHGRVRRILPSLADVERRPVLRAPAPIDQPQVRKGRLPDRADVCPGDLSPDLATGGETAAREVLTAGWHSAAKDYEERHDDLAGDATSRLSPYLHFGCLSPLDLTQRSGVTKEFVRQVCSRDFHAQLLAARPRSTTRDYRPRGDRWRRDRARTSTHGARVGPGFPLVDAGMRQLRAGGLDAQPGPADRRARPDQDPLHRLALGRAALHRPAVDGDVANNTRTGSGSPAPAPTHGSTGRFNLATQATSSTRRRVRPSLGPGAARRRRPRRAPPVELPDDVRRGSATRRGSSTRSRRATACGRHAAWTDRAPSGRASP